MSQSSLVDYGWFVCETDAVQFAYAMESMQGRSVYSDSGSPRSSKICPLVDENGSEVGGNIGCFSSSRNQGVCGFMSGRLEGSLRRPNDKGKWTPL